MSGQSLKGHFMRIREITNFLDVFDTIRLAQYIERCESTSNTIKPERSILCHVVLFDCINVLYKFDMNISRNITIGNMIIKFMSIVILHFSLSTTKIMDYDIIDRNSCNRRTRPTKYNDPAATSLYDFGLHETVDQLYTAGTTSIVFAIEKAKDYDKEIISKKMYEYVDSLPEVRFSCDQSNSE